jgi:hypothetical protein
VPQKVDKPSLVPLIPLFCLAVWGVFPVMPAKLLELEFLGHRLLVLRRAVIPPLALGALQRDDLASTLGHVPFLGFKQLAF